MIENNELEFAGQIQAAKSRYLEFLRACRSDDGRIRLTPNADPSAFATCFWVYGMHLLQEHAVLGELGPGLSEGIRLAVRNKRAEGGTECLHSKSYRQLLTFALSALSVLGTLADDPLEDLVIEQLPRNVDQDLVRLGCLAGVAQSGNQAMFLAVFMLHARDRFGLPLNEQIDLWVCSHVAHVNSFGFWGSHRNMTALQFQNGYHQYEIFEYLSAHTGREESAALAVSRLADRLGHFAPYPGGGGCYDYDAVFMLTPDGKILDDRIGGLLKLTSATLLAEQQHDGGFAESLYVRPRSLRNIAASLGHIADAWPNTSLFMERLRYGVALQQLKHSRIATHWSRYSRRWNESDLWDSWFRMLAVARIQCALNPGAAKDWGFIDFPGIGYHPSLRKADPKEAAA